MKKSVILLLILLLFSLTGCQNHITRSVFLMDTVVTFDLTHSDAERLARECEALTQNLEASLSAHIPSSDVSRFNRGEEVPLTDDLAELLSLSQSVAEATEGAYDITIAPLVTQWDISHAASDWRPPSQKEIEAQLPLVGFRQLKIENNTLFAPSGVQIDLGGIAKGWALGTCAAHLENEHVSGTVSFGGNIALVGQKSDGSDWRVGIKDPHAPDTLCGVLSLPSGIVAVSGGYERYAEYDGACYHHILDPKTGAPSESDVASAAVWVESSDAASGAVADALSTALFILGSERASELYERGAFIMEYVLVLNDGSIVVSDGLENRFTEQ